MTAHDIALSKTIHKDSDLITLYEAIEAMKKNARIQIAKDRERVKADMPIELQILIDKIHIQLD